MHAAVGDTLPVKATNQGEGDRRGKIIEVHGKEGEPPYLVPWQHEHESLFFPAAGTVVQHYPASGGRRAS
jgi:Domain of unknown function (DUF1918)